MSGNRYPVTSDAATGQITVPLVPVAGSDAASKSYVDGAVFTDPMTTAGDIIHRNAGNTTARLAVGAEDQLLTVSSGVPVWETPAVPVSTTLTFGPGPWGAAGTNNVTFYQNRIGSMVTITFDAFSSEASGAHAATADSGDNATALDAAYRPTSNLLFLVLGQDGGSTVHNVIRVNSDGTVEFASTTNGNLGVGAGAAGWEASSVSYTLET